MRACAPVCVFCLLLLSPCTHAGEILDSFVEHDEDRYRLRVVARVNAPHEQVYAHLTDYTHLGRVLSNVEESTVLSSQAHKHRIRIVSYDCVLIFCKRIVQVQDVNETADGRIVARIDPNGSDFHSGSLVWKVRADADATRVTLSMSFVPKFWVPPVIGPWLLKKKLVSQSEQAALALERLASP